MEIGTKGQFYILIMVFMISVIVGVAYFAAESKQLEQESEIEPEPGLQTIMNSYEAELRDSVAGGLYGGNPSFYYEVAEKLEAQAAEKGYDFSSTCDKTELNPYSAKLDCTLTLAKGESKLSTSFSHTYAVEFGIEMYSDEYYTDRTDKHHPGDTVYYRVTTPAPENTNLTVNYPNEQEKEQQQKSGEDFTDFALLGSFDVDETTGEWEIVLDDGTQLLSMPFYVQMAIVEITTYDEDWVPQYTFNRGELVRYRVEVDPSANVYVDVTADGQDRDYDWWSSAPSTLHESSFVVSSVESEGTLTLTAIEQNYFEEASTEITILYQPFGAWIFVPLDPTHAEHDAFGAGCGYDEWYPNDTTTYSGVPFKVDRVGDTVVRVSAGKGVIDAPNVYADKLHILASRCDSC
ncbi:MAG: hypothetical protein KAW41_04660 [Candidatus Diapherotrites archaeon]|nr:hypothetical protein [Candidatus Diapherotrites archaeon]